jgi:uncharacterized repeat protein (TIGR03843 family)
LVELRDLGLRAQGIYKPHRGERPLWDFPDGLYQREIAAYELSRELGWGIVPPTVMRSVDEIGVGSLQLYVPCVLDAHYFTIREAGTDHDDVFRSIAAFDLLINNTDRKGGHCLLGTDGEIYAIDHGVAFHHEFKLRTVIWDFAGEAIERRLLTDIVRCFDDGVPAPLYALLSPLERDALCTRAQALVSEGHFPDDDTGGMRWPYPLV